MFNCSTVQIGAAAPGFNESVVREGDDLDEPVDVSEGLADGRCSVLANTIGGARSLYEETCSDVRIDCDPVGSEWMCASYVIHNVALQLSSEFDSESGSGTEPVSNSASESEANVTTLDVASTGIRSPITPGGIRWADSYMDSDGLCWIRSTLDHGAGDLRVTVASGRTITVRQAFAEVGAGPGQHGDLAFNDVQCGHGPANNAGDEDINQCPGLVTRGRDGCSLRAVDGLWSDRL